jgi:hypothetical protein
MRMWLSGAGMRVASMRAVAALRIPDLSNTDIELHPLNAGPLSLGHLKGVSLQFQLLQLAFEALGIDSQVNQRTDEHVAGNAAE